MVNDKMLLAQMNQLKSTPHPGHDGISLSSMTMPHSEQIFFYETDQRYQHQGQSSDHRYKEIDWDEETYGEYE